jgi:hypothetical protein
MIQAIPTPISTPMDIWLIWLMKPAISFLLFIWIVNGLVSIITRDLYSIRVALWITLLLFFFGYIPFK